MVNSKHDFRLVLMWLVQVIPCPCTYNQFWQHSNFFSPYFFWLGYIPKISLVDCLILKKTLKLGFWRHPHNIQIFSINVSFIRLQTKCMTKLSFLGCPTEIVTYRSSQLEVEKGTNLANPEGGGNYHSIQDVLSDL